MYRRPDDFGTALADRLDPPSTGMAAYRDRPADFVNECFTWKRNREPAFYQLENLELLVEHKRLCVRGPHGLGKTTTEAWAVLWFALTRDAAGEDWKIPTTASAWRQLTKYLWPEIHKWSKVLRWDRVERDPFTKLELMTLNLKLRHGEAFAVASSDPASIEGAHADQVLYIYDEAKAIPAKTYDATEGAFSGAGDDTANEAYALASSTPGEPSGRFYEIQKRAKGLEDWHAVHVKKEDTVKAGRVSLEWAEQRKRQWGAESAVYLNRVEGEFASAEEDGVIPLGWVELANERWLQLADEGKIDGGILIGAELEACGVDVATTGKDKTVIARRFSAVIAEIRHTSKEDTMETTGRVQAAVHGTNAMPIIDVLNMGKGVVDRLRELGRPCVAFNASAGSKKRDSTGEFGFVNCRAAAWWNMRELLDPESLADVAIPPDDLLTGDLTTPKWKVMSGGNIQIESKDDIKKRIGRSTDDGDAVIQAFWEGERTSWRPL
jgi:hypothetical protein